MVGRIDAHHHAKFSRNCLSKADILRFFKFAQCLLPPLSWIFEITKFYWLFGWRRSRRTSTPNFVKIGQSVVKVLRFFVFQDGGRHHLGLSNSRNFNGWRCMEVRPITVPNFVKICRSVTEILRFFEFLRWPPPPSWIFEIAKIYWLLGWRGSRRISMPNFVKIGQSVEKILRFFDFSRWRPPSSWIVEFAKFYWLTVFGGAICITVPNFVKIVFLLWRYCNF